MEGETDNSIVDSRPEDNVRYFGPDFCNEKANFSKTEIIRLDSGPMEVTYRLFSEEEVLIIQAEHVKHDELDPATGKWKDYRKEEWESYTIALICESLCISRRDYDALKRNRTATEFKNIIRPALKLNGFGLTKEERDAEKNVVGQGP